MTTQSPASSTDAVPSPYRILVAVAFEPTAHAAMTEGMRLATRSPGAELHVVHVFSEPRNVDSELVPMSSARLKEASERLRLRIEAEWQQTGKLDVFGHVRSGDPAQAILQVAVDIDADLVIVGSHRRTGIGKLVLGSVAERVVRDAHCPVLVAITKDYSGAVATAQVDPPCAACLSTRKQTANAKFWCERHSRPHLEPHVYVPRDQGRSSVFPTY
jgi:nucleotide-binding universal stress UspA family protein